MVRKLGFVDFFEPLKRLNYAEYAGWNLDRWIFLPRIARIFTNVVDDGGLGCGLF